MHPRPKQAAPLFSTLVTYAEFLDWGTQSGYQVKDVLTHHAYVQFYKTDPKSAVCWLGCWRGEVIPEPGGYRVFIYEDSRRV